MSILWKNIANRVSIHQLKRIPQLDCSKKTSIETYRTLQSSLPIHISYASLYLWIQLSNGDGCDTINRFNPATFICLSQARTGFQTSYVEVFLCSVSEGEKWLLVLLILVEFFDITI
jgi:hypothetical protein